jgi:hypothetical protein
MPAAVFVVRAVVADASKRQGFDQWYRDVHLPDAVRSFGARKAWRFWSLTDPRCTRRCISSMMRPRWSAPSAARR